MPLYEYECSACGQRFEKIEPVHAPHKQKCPKCGKRAERLLAAPAIQFKGSGWYVTDYAGKSSGKAEAAEKPAGDAKPAETKKDAGESREKKEKKPAAKKGH